MSTFRRRHPDGSLPALGQVQGRTYANMFARVERFIGAKALELGPGHAPEARDRVRAATSRVCPSSDGFGALTLTLAKGVRLPDGRSKAADPLLYEP
jgi:hypothetical protein